MSDRSSHSPTPRRKRRPQRRDQIIAAAVRLLQERGYHGTGMDDIGAAAGITGPAIYRHFKNKEEILETILVDHETEALSRARRIVGEAAGPREALEGLVDLYVEIVLDSPAIALVALYERRTIHGDMRATVERAERLFTKQWVQALTEVRPELSAAEAKVLVHATNGLGLMAGTFRSGLDRSVVERLMRSMMLEALSVAPAKAGGGVVRAATR